MLVRIPPIVGIIVFVALSGALFKYVNGNFRASERSTHMQSTRPGPYVGSPPSVSPHEPHDISEQHRVATELLAQADQKIAEAVRLSSSWAGVIEKMQQGEASEAIAVQEDLVDKIAFLTRQERPSDDDMNAVRSRVSESRSRLEQLSKESPPAPLSAREMADIRELQLISESAVRQWEDAHRQVRAIERVAMTLMMPKRSPSLEEKIRDTNDLALLKDVEQAHEFAKQEQVERRARKRELDNRKLESEQARLELEERAASPEVTSLLAPLLHPRDVQPVMSGSAMRLRKTIDVKPMSLQSLHEIGAFHSGAEGLKRLAMAGGNRKLKGPKWSVHSQPGNWSVEDKEMLSKARQILLELGPTLVRLDMLSP